MLSGFRAGIKKDAYAKGIPSGQHDFFGVLFREIYTFLQNNTDSH
jgi:hypothetical protein